MAVTYRLQLLAELLHFLRDRKRWWLAPFIATLLLVGGLLFVTQTASMLPFLYPLF